VNQETDRFERDVCEESIIAIRQKFNYLVELVLDGEMQEDEFFGKLEDFFYVDDSGTPWMISLKNGNWNRITEQGPVPGEPPEVLYRPIDEPADEEKPRKKFCTHCGGQLQEESRFCRMCGKQV
jgi:zinc-ribbon domain